MTVGVIRISKCFSPSNSMIFFQCTIKAGSLNGWTKKASSKNLSMSGTIYKFSSSDSIAAAFQGSCWFLFFKWLPMEKSRRYKKSREILKMWFNMRHFFLSTDNVCMRSFVSYSRVLNRSSEPSELKVNPKHLVVSTSANGTPKDLLKLPSCLLNHSSCEYSFIFSTIWLSWPVRFRSIISEAKFIKSSVHKISATLLKVNLKLQDSWCA